MTFDLYQMRLEVLNSVEIEEFHLNTCIQKRPNTDLTQHRM